MLSHMTDIISAHFTSLSYVGLICTPFFLVTRRNGRNLVKGNSSFAIVLARLNFISNPLCISACWAVRDWAST